MNFLPHYKFTHKISKVIDKKKETFDVSTLEDQNYMETDDYITIFEKVVTPEIKVTFDFLTDQIKMIDTNERNIRYTEKVNIGDEFLLVAFPNEKNYNPYFNHEYFREDTKLYEFRFFIKGCVFDIVEKNDDKTIKFKINEIIPFFYRKNTCLNLIDDFVLEPSHIVKFTNERFEGDIKDYFNDENSSTFKISNTNLKYIEADSNGDIFMDLHEHMYGNKIRVSFLLDKTETDFRIVCNKKL